MRETAERHARKAADVARRCQGPEKARLCFGAVLERHTLREI